MPIDEILLKRLNNKDPNLKEIDLSNKSLTDDDMQKLASVIMENTIVETLNLENNQITAKGIQHIAPWISKSKSISLLVLNQNNIGDEGLINISEHLELNTSLYSFEFINCGITGKGVIIFALALSKRICPISINLDSNKIGDEGKQALSELHINLSNTNKIINEYEKIKPIKTKFRCTVQ